MKELVVLINNLETIQKACALGCTEAVIGIENATFSAIQKYPIDILREYPNVSVFMNRFYFQDEQDVLLEQLQKFKEYNVKHIYFQDPAVLQISKQLQIENKLIYRPDTLSVSVPDISFWLAQGIHSVSISPLITLEETEYILEHTKDTEITIHGHLTMSYSYRQLVSSYQSHINTSFTKEDLYLQESKRDGLMPIYEDALGTIIYSDYVLESFHEINELHASRYFIDSTYLNEDVLLDTVKLYNKLLNDKNDSNEIENYIEKYSNLELSSGYYKEKTVK